MSVIGSNILAGASGQGGDYTIEESLRFNASQSSYLSKTLASIGSLRAWTWSAWVKRGTLSSNQHLFGWIDTNGGNFQHAIYFVSDNTLEFEMYNSVLGGYVNRKNTAQVFRDTSAWYHLVVVWDSNNATAEDRARIYINGSRVTAWANNTNPALNQDSYINNALYPLGLGRAIPSGVGYFDGYITEVNFIDGQALDPSSFGETDATTGVWKPKKYTGTYGTNGFFLDFSDATSATTLGYDYSGNSNNWTLNNFNTTSTSTAYCSMTDTPTPYLGGGNYAVLNPLFTNQIGVASGFTGTRPTITNGNLTATAVAGSIQASVVGSIGVSSGKWYLEYTPSAVNSTGDLVGFVCAFDGSLAFAGYRSSGNIYTNGSATSGYATWTAGDTIGIALDIDGSTVSAYKNGTLIDTLSLTSAITSECYPVIWFRDPAGAGSANFGQRPFAYTPPTGFKALHTGNLPDSSIVDGSQYFNAVLYTGNTSGASVTGIGFQPDFVWSKNRSVANNHELIDVVRGGSSALFSNLTNAEATQQRISSFDSDGWTYTTNSNSALANPYVAWNWKANGTGVSNTDGSITSTVSANPTAGFSIVTYTGTGANATVGHGLGVAPKMVIVKQRSGAGGAWVVWHGAFGTASNTDYVVLNGTGAKGYAGALNMWNATVPTSSVFSIGTYVNVNSSAETYVAYCFAEVESYSKFGSYLGNGSTDGPFVYTNFRPAFLLFKRTDSAADWTIHDFRRLGYNSNDFELYPSGSYAETGAAGSARSDFLSNGFKIRANSGGINASGGTYIYMAFAETDFAHALAR